MVEIAAANSENGGMRKKIVGSQGAAADREADQRWIDLERVATVEATSEDPAFPVEAAFDPSDGRGWRASQKVEQQIRLVFDAPVAIRRIQLQFQETTLERMQEFTLRWSSVAGGPMTEIVRQQWNFSPGGSTTEVEDYQVDLAAVSVLELAIQPDVSRREAMASLALWRIG
jgi:hypothetical protein